ncbi:8-oxo-dGTP diphosphatase [Microlunatus panaciterrae]|uniref:8-oxo-dGTP diphosphatase n=1 Tax=Microlunatus panaciterrae TaxID=400768 RepID=A0ABS2RH38_9ACTN|nr:(deoxy)nucleoside triphosphate pyrophosphohydrolase [Microlunatus panaciterrae]MBM7797862.1 8-oxo-dGTP diphosphatase [Microlunatus panaciterrae]
MTEKILVVGAIIVDDLDRPTRLLAARRCRPAELAGRWEFPGGKVEPGEEPTAALIREIAEELRVEIEVGAELAHPAAGCWPISSVYAMRVWFVRITSGEPVPADSHDAVRWTETSDLGQLDWLPADVAVVQALVREIPEKLDVDGFRARHPRL